MPIREMLIAGAVLMAFAIAGAGLVAYTHSRTETRIADNERLTLLHRLNDILSASEYDNAIVEDTITVTSPKLGSNEPLTVYRARKNRQPVAAILTVVAPDGYSGPIKLLVGIYSDGRLAGVRAVSHSETPGLGDLVEAEKSAWITDFAGKSLDNPPSEKWAVRKDGGVFDQFTGATITPRAVVKAVHHTLTFFQENKAQLFAEPTGKSAPATLPAIPNEQLNLPTTRGEAHE